MRAHLWEFNGRPESTATWRASKSPRYPYQGKRGELSRSVAEECQGSGRARWGPPHDDTAAGGDEQDRNPSNPARSMEMKSLSHLIAPLLAAIAVGWGISVQAASHREAPLIAMDPSADNTDVYAFVSYDAANLARAVADRKVTFILNVNPGQDPSDGPNYFNFGDDVLYAIKIDNNRDGVAEDIVYE